MRVTVAEIAQSGGYEAWHRRETAKANAHPVKLTALDGGNHENGGKYGLAPKNATSGQESGKKVHARGEPNQTERRYRDEFLIPRILSGEIVECVFEGACIILKPGRLAKDRCTYAPDFWVRTADGRYEAHEIKGAHVFEDSRIKLKWAVTVLPLVRFVWAQWRGGAWKISTVRNS